MSALYVTCLFNIYGACTGDTFNVSAVNLHVSLARFHSLLERVVVKYEVLFVLMSVDVQHVLRNGERRRSGHCY